MPNRKRKCRWSATGLLLLALLACGSTCGAAQGIYHKIQQGETLDDVARRYRISAYHIAGANKLGVNAKPSPGSRLWIPGARAPVLASPAPVSRTPTRTPASTSPKQQPAVSRSLPDRYTVAAGDSLWKVAREHGVTVDDLAAANGLGSRAGLEIGQVLRIPRPGERAEPASRAGGGDYRPSGANSSSQKASRSGYIWPVEGTVIQRFADSASAKHAGIDIAVPRGTEVRAARDGEVIYAGSSISAYGNMVIIKHSNGHATCYAFNSKVLVRVDQRVNRGQTIALSGDSGKQGRPTLHFQLRKGGDAVDPVPYLP